MLYPLEVFVTTAETGSFHRAAEKLYVTPAAVMKQINRLEKDLGFSLFERTRLGLRLTESGESYLKDARFLLSYANDAAARAASRNAESVQPVRIGVSQLHGPDLLLKRYADLCRICPQMTYQLVPIGDHVEDLRKQCRHLGNQVDLITLITDPFFLEKMQQPGVTLEHVPVRIAVSTRNALAMKNTLAPSDLKGQRILMVEDGWIEAFDALKRKLRKRLGCEIEEFGYFDYEAFNRCEREGSLMAVIDDWKNVHPLLKVLGVEWNETVPYGFVHARHPSLSVQQFLDALNQLNEVSKK